jgi:DNA-binding SARP family transcriptional activator/tetratricopeptide (TPR) repeat protein
MSAVSRAGTPELDVKLLGPLEVSQQGRRVAIGGPKPRALLAVLALDPGRVVSVDQLVENLWPGEPPDTAAHAVQVYVSQLRKALGTEMIQTRAPGYVLEVDPGCVDALRFVRLASEGRETLAAGDAAAASTILREALAVWRGPALADFTYQPFAQTEIARLEELRLVALEERVEADLALRRESELVSELEALVDAQPLRERPRAQLMLALYRAGRQADALAAYRGARNTLIEELGVEPGPRLKELEAAILRQDESLLPEAEAPVPAMEFRRLVTVLFADVVESMALAETLDAEALGRVLRQYFETISAVLSRHGGTIEKFAGDAVMAVFGIPVSHEDDALRAARAALDIRVAMAALNEQLVRDHRVGLEIRIGIETGEVVASQSAARQRLVTGEVVGIAARLEQSAGTDEVVVGERAGRLIDHAAQLEPLGELEIKGKREPVRAYRLLEMAAEAPAFDRRLDAPLVGRRRELAALRKALKRAVSGEAVEVEVVVGPPGVGKSRLAAELASRAKSVTILTGRCLSYGEGITYWPLREVLGQTVRNGEGEAVLAALDADTPPPAPEIAWLFRQFCEALARADPLVLVFDDVHWAEPTFLELVEHLAEKGTGPILILCLARDELLQDRPSFLEGRPNVEQLLLDALSADETDALLEGLGGAVLESDQRARVVETAEGNPFFLEQLLALALEGGLVDRALPETIQALLAARLDRLGPGERAVLERGAVVGKEFTAEDIMSLLNPQAAPTAGAHLDSLARRGFVRRRAHEAFAFRHILVQQAVYRAAPKRLRAELHERFGDQLDNVAHDVAEIDEFVGYHLEQAYRLRTELGESDRRMARLAEDGGRRLGEAGIRAWKRNDAHATVNLLGRATSLLPRGEPLRRELLCEFGPALRTSGDPDGSVGVLVAALDESRKAGDRRVELRARVEREYVRLLQEPGTTADRLLEAVAAGLPIFETVGDDRSLGRTWLIAGFVHGGHRGQYQAWHEAAERALHHYKNANWPISTCLGEIVTALYYGPTPVQEAITRCEKLRRDELSDRVAEANIMAFLGGLVSQCGDFNEGRKLVDSATTTYEDLGQQTAVTTYCTSVLGDIEMLADEPEAAEQLLRAACEELERTHDFNHLASRASDLAEALYAQGRFDEAHQWTGTAQTCAARDDLGAQLLWRGIRAKIDAQRGAIESAKQLASEAVRLSESSDGLNRQAKAQRDLGEVLRLAGQADEAGAAFTEAARLYELKGNTVGAALTRALRDDLALV